MSPANVTQDNVPEAAVPNCALRTLVDIGQSYRAVISPDIQ
jgi:hypothetical protein